MPCNSDYMMPNERERELTKVVLLLDELDGKGHPDPDDFKGGFDPRVYNQSTDGADALVARLCSRLAAHPDVSSLSLEAQIWWREHQKVDRRRQEAADAQ